MPRTALFTPALLAALTCALLAMSRPAAAQAPGWQPEPLLVAQKHRRPRTDGRKIACTPFGCHRIPLGCYPTPEFDFWGMPTGYDKIICRRRR